MISPGSHGDRSYSRQGGVVQNPGGGHGGHRDNHHHGGWHDGHIDNHHNGSLDSIYSHRSSRSSSLSFDSSLSYGRNILLLTIHLPSHYYYLLTKPSLLSTYYLKIFTMY